MILFCVLIPYAFVNVLAVNIDEYTTMVDITSGHIEAAINKKIENETLNGFECTLRSIVRGKKYSFEKVLLLAEPGYMSFYKKLQDEISSVTGLAKPSPTEGLTLEDLGDKIRKNTRQAL
ncbi:uncharacterized protein LOC126833007 isoform X2 [Adelges cooleyi]|uniref:uncharacterized protein LOC126833007 isoform X2 n=1 Tax=Adelges cooleyi TaxID=133065 RepID=UPI00217FFFAE|nr:uncharacterized protein LOC126833007 isoform X2 [Adelges cooleyi]